MHTDTLGAAPEPTRLGGASVLIPGSRAPASRNPPAHLPVDAGPD